MQMFGKQFLKISFCFKTILQQPFYRVNFSEHFDCSSCYFYQLMIILIFFFLVKTKNSMKMHQYNILIFSSIQFSEPYDKKKKIIFIISVDIV